MTRTTGPITRISIPSKEEYEWLNAIRQDLGLTWRGMMLKAEQRLLAAECAWPDSFRTEATLTDTSARPDADAETESDTDTGRADI